MIEDNSLNQKLTKMILKSIGLTCDVIDDGQIAFDHISEFRKYDVILLDCQLPGVSGYDIAAGLRKLEEKSGEHIPVIGMTANALEGDRQKCLQSGMDDYLSKPIKKQLFHDALRRWLPDL